LHPNVVEAFVSVPAMTGYTGSGGTSGAWPGYPSPDDAASYVDAVNHAKRITADVTFSLGYGDVVTWYKGQNTAAHNVQGTVYLYHNTDGHNDPDWWTEGTQWLSDILSR
ncbi:MAG TPA: hypothetical protein VKS21_12965, partial [Spirochaetota bacterium]|nr:hypothetical protein [Spirochaetota bacterium]